MWGEDDLDSTSMDQRLQDFSGILEWVKSYRRVNGWRGNLSSDEKEENSMGVLSYFVLGWLGESGWDSGRGSGHRNQDRD